jgi:Flp pilus assembly protein TadG
MTGRALRRLRRDAAGSTSVEFAMTALSLLVVTLGVVELGVVCWSWQVLEGAASDAARCAGINATGSPCANVTTTPSNTQTYAATAAQTRGLSSITTSNVTVSTGTGLAACGSTTANVVSVTLTYQISLVFVVALPSSISATACYPIVAAAG